uniref:Defensin-like protein n=1 Tax=Bursaphelenchus xylophilus TaxID=6326 RepID=A0A1I7SR68_BURXY
MGHLMGIEIHKDLSRTLAVIWKCSSFQINPGFSCFHKNLISFYRMKYINIVLVVISVLAVLVSSNPVKEQKPAFVGYCNKDSDCHKECQDFCSLVHNADCNKYQCAGKRCYQTCLRRAA